MSYRAKGSTWTIVVGNCVVAIVFALGAEMFGCQSKTDLKAKRSTETLKASSEPDHLSDQGLALLKSGKCHEAQQPLSAALAALEKSKPTESASIANLMANLGTAYSCDGQYTKAEPVLKRALSIYERTLKANDPTFAFLYHNLAQVLHATGRFPEEEAMLQREIAIMNEAEGPDGPDATQSLDDLGGFYEQQGRLDEAELMYKRALTLDEGAPGRRKGTIGKDHAYLGNVYRLEKRYPEAEKALGRALVLQEAELGINDSETVHSLRDLAELYEDEGKYDKAEPLINRLTSAEETAFGSDSHQVASDKESLGLLYQYEHRYPEAQQLLNNAIEIDKKVLAPDDPEIAEYMYNLGNLFSEDGLNENAELMFKGAISIHSKAFGPNSLEAANDITALGALYVQYGRYSDAQPLLRKGLDIRQKNHDPNESDLGESFEDLGALYLYQGQNGKAEPLLKKGLSIEERKGNHYQLIAAQNNLGQVFKNTGRYDEAEPLFKRAIAIAEKEIPSESAYSELLQNLAIVEWDRGRLDLATQAFERALNIEFNSLPSQLASMSEIERLKLMAKPDALVPIYFSFVHDYHEREPQAVAEMFDVALFRKAIVLDSIAVQRAKLEGLRGKTNIEVELADRLKIRIREKAAELASQDPNGESSQDMMGLSDAIEESTAQQSIGSGQITSARRTSWKEIQTKLSAGMAAVEVVKFPYFNGKQWTGNQYYAALVLTSNDHNLPRYVFLGDSRDVEETAESEAEVDFSSNKLQDTRSEEQSGFWGRLEPALQGAHIVILSSEGVFNQLPMAIVIGTEGKRLIDNYEFRMVLSTRDVVKERSLPVGNEALLMGDPDFNLSDSQKRNALNSPDSDADFSRTQRELETRSSAAGHDMSHTSGVLSHDLSATTLLEPLPQTAKEISDVGRILQTHGWKVAQFTRERASKDAILFIKHPRVLHIATHGFFLPDQSAAAMTPTGVRFDRTLPENPMLRAGLFLAGANRRVSLQLNSPDLDDGVLSAFEASALDLHGTELVVLSACETGLGQNQTGEGVFGLRRALREAGAESILMSMWKVPRFETRELMTTFYRNWLDKGLKKSAALRGAEQAEREIVKLRYGEDRPRLWGAFVLSGE